MYLQTIISFGIGVICQSLWQLCFSAGNANRTRVCVAPECTPLSLCDELGWTLSNQCFSLLVIFSSYFNFSSNNCCTRYTDLAMLFFWSSCRKILEVRSSFCGFAGIFRHNSHCAKKFVVISLNHKLFSFLWFSSSVPRYIYNDHFKLCSVSLSVVLGPQYVLSIWMFNVLIFVCPLTVYSTSADFT